MVVRLRLARHGRTNSPFFHIIAINSTKAVRAQPIEKLGEYDPIARKRSNPVRPIRAWEGVNLKKSREQVDRFNVDRPILKSGINLSGRYPLEKRIEFDVERIKHWLSVGAQPTPAVRELLDRAGLLPLGKIKGDDWIRELSANDAKEVVIIRKQEEQKMDPTNVLDAINQRLDLAKNWSKAARKAKQLGNDEDFKSYDWHNSPTTKTKSSAKRHKDMTTDQLLQSQLDQFKNDASEKRKVESK